MPASYSWDKGWVQRANRNLYEPNELIDAVNMLPDPEGGGITTRRGDSLFNTLGAPVHSFYSTYTAAQVAVNYQGAGTALYRYFLPIVTGLTSAPISFATMPGFGEKTVYTFFAGGQEALRLKDNGQAVSTWGIRSPTAFIQQSAAAVSAGQLQGNYAWKQVYVRKPVISGGVFGRWDNAAGNYTLASTFPWFLGDGVANNGTVFGAPEPWNEVVLQLQLGTAAPGGSIDYSYWNGAQWVVYFTGPFHIWSATQTSFRTERFPLSNWVIANGYYFLRIRLLTFPPVNPILTAAVWYDGVFSARSNPSPPGAVSGPYGAPPLPNQATVLFSNPNAIPDNESKATHVAIYRTTGDDAGALAGQLPPPPRCSFLNVTIRQERAPIRRSFLTTS